MVTLIILSFISAASFIISMLFNLTISSDSNSKFDFLSAACKQINFDKPKNKIENNYFPPPKSTHSHFLNSQLFNQIHLPLLFIVLLSFCHKTQNIHIKFQKRSSDLCIGPPLIISSQKNSFQFRHMGLG